MADPRYFYDGHNSLRGVWGGSPDAVPPNYAHQAGNRIFREDYNKARYSIQSIELTFETDEDRIWFAGANGQGATFYNSYPSTNTSCLIASVGGRIYRINVFGRSGTVTKLFDGNNRQFVHAWFAQGFQWLVIQDGISPPILWDGQNAPRRSDIAKNEVPIGSVMAFIHGRFVVASADGKNSIFVGDIAYGDTTTNPNNILNFTERTYWAEGGNFNTPIEVGDIMGLYPMPFLDTGTGQNELVVACRFGFTSLDLSAPRDQWVDNQVQRVSLVGDGLSSTHGFAGLNGDMFYRSDSGINSYRNARIQYAQKWNQTPVSREVNYWLKPDRRQYLEFVPMISNENMLFTGCSPFIASPNNPNFGVHRYCRGIVVFDADSMSTAGREGTPVWHGMWSGIRPWAFAQGYINGTPRCFAFSFDRDGRNRLYEITIRDGPDYFQSTPRKIEGFYDTGLFGNVETVTNAFQPKIFNGGVIEVSDVLNASEFRIQYRPDGAPCWVPVGDGQPGCDCPEREPCTPTPPFRSLTSAPQWARQYFQQVPSNVCIPGSVLPANNFHHCQVRVYCTGNFTVDRLNIRFELRTDSQIAECLGNNCEPVDCCPAENDYAYHIAPAGTNNEIPDVPVPPVQPFVATRTVRICCPQLPTVCVTAQGQGESFVSQQDADNKAQQAAVANAQQMLVCPDCTPSVEFDFFIDGGVEDLSGFFTVGLYEGFTGRPWRLYDVLVDQYIAIGTVDDTGTLLTEATYDSFTHGTFDPNTNQYTDNDGGWTRIQLQLGCNIGGNYSWPQPGEYGS